MNEPDPLAELFAAARAQRPNTSRAELGFETRLMARLRERRQPDSLSLWSLVTWRMLPFFGACAVALALWNSTLAAQSEELAGASFLQQPDTAVLNGLN